MSNKPWIAASMMLVMSLGLAGCGNGEDESAVEDTPPEPTESVPAQDATEREAPPEEVNLERPTPATDPMEGASIDETAGNNAGSTRSGVDETGNVDQTTNDLPAGTTDAPVEPGEQMIPADPEVETPDTRSNTPAPVDEQTALPGEPSESDIEEFMQETERRFEEAQRQIDEQFEEVESQEPATGTTTGTGANTGTGTSTGTSN